MPLQLPQNIHAFVGAAVIGIVSAAGIYLVERYRQEQQHHAMAKDLARLDRELSMVRRELAEIIKQKDKKSSSKSSKKSKKCQANSTISSSTADYQSANELDSSDLEFYDVSDEEDLIVTNHYSSDNLETILKDIDYQLDEGTLSDVIVCLDRLKDLCMEHPENPDLLWRLGKVQHKIFEKSEDKGKRKECTEKGVEACESALRLKPDLVHAHKWIAVLIGDRAEFQSTKDKINDSYLFKEHVDAAIQIDPKDPTLHYMLGRFAFEIASLKWYERKVAAALFGAPPTISYDEALEHFLRADSLIDYAWAENKLYVAKSYIALNQIKEAIKWLQTTLESNRILKDEKIDEEANSLLEKYKSHR